MKEAESLLDTTYTEMKKQIDEILLQESQKCVWHQMHGPILAMILLLATWQYPLKLACSLNLFVQETKVIQLIG